jgi:hypothetical protein
MNFGPLQRKAEPHRRVSSTDSPVRRKYDIYVKICLCRLSIVWRSPCVKRQRLCQNSWIICAYSHLSTSRYEWTSLEFLLG